MKNRKITIAVIAVLVISVLGLGIAFAAFSRNLTINGNGTIQSSQFKIIFEGLTNVGTLDAPQTTGSASVTTAPTIKNDATEISSFVASLRTPGDSITYNFKIHNTGDYAATVSSVVMASGVNLTTDTAKRSSEANTLNAMDYKLFYTDNNALVGSGNAKDCLEPGESENVTLRIVFSSSNETNTNVLPSEALLLDNLGITVNYTQSVNGSCALEQAGDTAVNASFTNFDGAYYTYEGKSFIGTGTSNVMIADNIIGLAQYATANGTDNGPGANPRYTFSSMPAKDMAESYCSGCRLMTLAEAAAWTGCLQSQINIYECSDSKLIGRYNGDITRWWLADAYVNDVAWSIYIDGSIDRHFVVSSIGVRPAVSIPSGATITGSGTSGSPYVITVSQ